MIHSETRRIVPGAKNAVLFLHGIVGTPNHFRTLLPLENIVPESWSVINVCYPGHGSDAAAFGKSCIDQWRGHARAAFLELAENHGGVFLVGHSMGTLFAIQLALEFPEKVSELFLLNVPLRPWVRLYGIVNCLRAAFHCIRPDRPLEKATQEACGIHTTPFLWRYLPWIPRYLELFREIYRTEKTMGALDVACTAWQSERDELVSSRAASVLRKSGIMEVWELPESTHFYYAPEDAARVLREFEKRIKKISG